MATRKPLFLTSEAYHQEMANADDLVLGGLSMGGAIDMSESGTGGPHKITNLAAGTSSGDALSYGQSGAQLNGLNVDTGDLTLSNSATITGLPSSPTGDTEAASKSYVDSTAQGLDVHDSVRAATTTSGTLSSSFANGSTIDGITLATGDRILIKDQGSAIENGVYIVKATGTPDRADDWAIGYEAAGAFAFVEEGDDNADSGWVCTSDSTADTVGTHNILFSKFSGAGQITAGTGMAKDGNTLNVGAGNGITANADTVEVKPDTTTAAAASANSILVAANGVNISVDNSTIEGSNAGSTGAESLRVKDGGITGAKLASDITINTSGNITANQFSGDGSNLTNLPSAASTDAVSVSAIKSTAGTINKGQAVHLVGYSAGDYTVELADADNAALNPAIGIATSQFTEAAAGTVVMSGRATGLNTGSWSAGDSLYVSTTAGTLVNSRPTGSTTKVQRIGEVAFSNASTGEILVLGAGRSNDLPNITENNVWVGNSSGVGTETPVGNGFTVTPGTTLAVESDTTTGGSTKAVAVSANGVGFDIDSIDGAGLEVNSGLLRLAAAAAGDGLEGGAGSALSVHLEATNPSLQIDTDELGLKMDANGGLQKGAGGVAIKLDDTPDTLDVDSSGLKVTGLPSTFKVNGTSVGASVTAPNLDSLTDGSNADTLHIHAAAPATEAPKVESDLSVNEAVAVADPVYWSSTSGRVGKGAANTDSKSRIIGVARTAQATPGNDATVVSVGLAGSTLSGATPGTPYYLQATGGIGTSLPAAGNRVILCGYASTATDLWVTVRDYGKLAA